jgi:cystathionine gamma-lyase/cystathionine beta-lyase/cystathionine gamma-lyase/homocysteine desulfhydrase
MNDQQKTNRQGFSTRAIHAGQSPDPSTGAIMTPIYATSTYVHDELGVHKGFEYARVQNPTRAALEANVAALEGGATGHAFASGMSAIAALMTFVRAGEHVVFSRNVYGGTYRFLTQVLDRYDVRSSWVDSRDLAEIRAAIVPETRMIYVETPTNPMMEITDLAGAAQLAREKGLLLAVDNTFMSPYFQRPLELGADFVVHSTTKFLNGHSDSIGGALVTRSAEHGEWLAFVQKSEGAIPRPSTASSSCAARRRSPCAWSATRRTRGRSSRRSSPTPRSGACCGPACPPTPATRYRRGRRRGSARC